MAPLTNYERETIIRFNEEEREAVVFTYNRTLQRQLDQLTQERPEEITLTRSDQYSAAVTAKEYRIPKKWLKVRPNRTISVEEKTKRTEYVKLARESIRKKNSENTPNLG